MKAILLADRQGAELLPLTHRTCVALLPIATKPLIEYALEALLATDIREVIIVASAYVEAIKRHLEGGRRWRLKLDYVLSRGQEDPALLFNRLGRYLGDSEYLVIRADMLFSLDIGSFLKRAQTQTHTVFATVTGHVAGLCLLRKQANYPYWQAGHTLQWNPTIFKTGQGVGTPIEMAGRIAWLDSLKNFHQTNLAVVAGYFPTLILPGWRPDDNDKLVIGHRALISKDKQGFIGAYCRVYDRAQLADDVVLCHEVIVDHDAQLKATVVLPETYIGRAITLHNAIVWGNILIQVDRGVILANNDSFWFTDLKTKSLTALLVAPLNRLLGVVVIFLSFPLWFIALGVALWQNPPALLKKTELCGNLKYHDHKGRLHPKAFTAFEWVITVPVLQHLPKLLAIIQGHIRWVGVSAQSPQQHATRTALWEKVRDESPVGLIGPCQLMSDTTVTAEECLLIEAHYARTRGQFTDFMWLLRGLGTLFTKRAWSTQFYHKTAE